MEPAKTRPATVMDPMEMSMGEVYAQALLDSLPDDAQAQDTAAELEALADVLQSIPDAGNLLSGWVMPARERAELVHRLFAGRVSEKVEAFLSVLNRRGRMPVLPAAVRSFRKLLNRRDGRIEVLVTTAEPMDDAQRTWIEQELAVSLAGKAVVRMSVDEKLMGGAVLRIGDRVYDASIRAQLAKYREKIASRRMDMKTTDSD